MAQFIGEFFNEGLISDVEPIDTVLCYGLKFWSILYGGNPSFIIASFHHPEIASQRVHIFTDIEGGFDPTTLPAFISQIEQAAKYYDYHYIMSLKQADSPAQRPSVLPRLQVVPNPPSKAKSAEATRQAATVVTLPIVTRPKIERSKNSTPTPSVHNIIYPHPQWISWGGKNVQSDGY